MLLLCQTSNTPRSLLIGCRTAWLLMDYVYEAASTPADCIVIQTARVVCCMLLQGKLPELAANLIAALPNLDGDQLPRHG